MTVQPNTRNMKTTLTIAFLLLPLALAISGNPAGSPPPYEIVLDGERVVFDKAESVSSQFVIRDLGVKKMLAPDLYWGLSVVWDGKEFKRDPKQIGFWNGPVEIMPRTAWRGGFSLSEYLVPAEALTVGRHTIALKDDFAESNTLTVFIEATKAAASAVVEATWDKPFAGLSVRLRADKTGWTTTETPILKLDLRNQGQRKFFVVQSQGGGRLQVDNVWYDWTGGMDMKTAPLPPGREYLDVPVLLGSDWTVMQIGRDKTQAPPPRIPLKLLPGRHTIRFTPEIREITEERKPQNVYVPSNPVEIRSTDR
jgi:hypothetical protein